jgi:hypothetical protein
MCTVMRWLLVLQTYGNGKRFLGLAVALLLSWGRLVSALLFAKSDGNDKFRLLRYWNG